jgi:HAE1 family hydrophobic/amphiphilic exporter-1
MIMKRSPLLVNLLFSAALISAGATAAMGQTEPIAATGTTLTPAASELSKPVETKAAMPDRPSLARVGVQSAQPLPLALKDAIRKALENNNTIEVTRDDVRFQETQIRSILGFYDPVFTVTPTYTRNSTTGNASTSDFIVNSNLQHFVRPGGGNYQVYFNNTRTENAFSQAQASSGSIGSSGGSALFSSSLGIRYTQPLFRNLKVDNTRRNLKIARRRLEQSDADFRRQTIETIAQVQRNYWDLVFALRDQQNRQANLDLTRENLRQVIARIDAGAAAPLARWEVETELANRESELLVATQQVSITENALKQLILRDASSAEWIASYVPTDTPSFSIDPISLDSAIKDAMDNRWELRRLKLATDINNIDIRYFKDQTKPQIDLVTNFSLDGFSRGGASTDSLTVPLIATDPISPIRSSCSRSVHLTTVIR